MKNILKTAETTQALKSVKGLGNTVDYTPKWTRTLPDLIYLSWHIDRNPPPQNNIKYQSIKVDI